MNINQLNKIPEGKKIAMILRHAERFPIENMERAFDALLTENGKQIAKQLGEKLSALSPVTFFFSPVDRCRQTAECMISGIISSNGTAELAGMDLMLGAPYLIGDWKFVAEAVTKHGQEKFIRSWFNGEVPEDILLPLDKAAEKQLKYLILQLESIHSNSISITHDWNIVLLKEYYFGIKHEQSGMPEYLEGMFAYTDNDKIHLFFNDKEAVINIRDYL